MEEGKEDSMRMWASSDSEAWEYIRLHALLRYRQQKMIACNCLFYGSLLTVLLWLPVFYIIWKTR
jgi:hypothetical protein